MSITRVGATKKYSDNWDNIFGNGRGNTSSAKRAAPAGAKSASRKAAKKKSARAAGRKKSR